ncbi:uncharacterized protein LACBIDRAFT_302066 [Laccaria bicolor S238N-H82]|uniref:Predicted protein n=1 Tax=Laccaria bicolor (strain S238N-H82 / ATCC MYA-4686) TaxID=486041 RepID=B0E3Y2_LACBS|nr:uncharacterized protein LACBIDRAFT_302066 [Laccaria bicolor S238N-H82]EDQ98447.1 predicted protein [Laccaria bicolor S238N-H82]|eukprot:XP_001890900.1 predicted protein [Laccaria bicolor S238N-H82]
MADLQRQKVTFARAEWLRKDDAALSLGRRPQSYMQVHLHLPSLSPATSSSQ